MMAVDLSRALDPVVMALDCGITPDAWQAKLLRDEPRKAALLCSRQSGKSTTTALAALHCALYQAAALILLFSPSQRQSQELFRTIVGFHGKLKGVPEMTAENTMRAELANGSRIIALPGTEKTVRGYAAADLCIVDEASRVDDLLLPAITGSQATKMGARLIALTTPAGKRGWFYEMWINNDDWTKIKVPASQVPRISQEFLDGELKELGQAKFDEEYNLVWRDPDEAVWPTAIIENAFSSHVRPLWAA